jgi:hypothetical protein
MIEHGRVCCNSQVAHNRRPAQEKDFILSHTEFEELPGLLEVAAAGIGGVKQDVDVDGKTHAY